MSTGTDAGADMPANHANEGDTSNGGAADIDAKMNRIATNHFKRLEAKMAQQFTQISSVLERLTETAKPEQRPEAGNNADPEKATQKARIETLEADNKAIKDQFKALQKAAQDATAQAQDTRRRSEFQSRLAAKLGADSPHLGPLMDSLYDVRKRVVESDGRLSLKFVDQWGNEELKPLDDGVNALFDGEFKHLVQQSKASALPPSGYRGMGKPIPGTQKVQGQPQLNPLDRDLIEAVAKDRPELAEALASQALAAAQNK